MWYVFSSLKKDKVIEDRIIRKTTGCEECDTLVLKTIKKIRKMKAYSFDNKSNTVSKITILFGKSMGIDH